MSLVPLPLRSLPASDLLGDLIAVSLTGIIYYTPIYDPAGSGDIVDFRFEYLNPTAQRMMSMPEVPTLTHNEQWPHSKAHGTFDFHVEAYVTGEPREYNINYQADGYDNYYRLAARRSGDGMWVSFTDTADQPRSPVEIALRESQAREKAARAEAEDQRQRLHRILMELPASIATFQGPDMVYSLVSPGYQQLFQSRPLLGRPIREALPELVGQSHLEHLDHVYRTGEAYYGTEVESWADFAGTGQIQRRYFNISFQPLRDGDGAADGILNFGYDVTEQVEARQQVEQLNQELEARVQERTAELTRANEQLQYVNADLDTFIYTASHDLKAPISNIEGLLHLLQEDLGDATDLPDVAPTLTQMLDSVERFKRTIDHLTDVSKLQKAHNEPATAVDVAAVVEGVRQDLLPQIQVVGAELAIDVAALPAIQFSEKNLRSVIYNLLSNALKYHAPERPSRVAVRAFRRADHAVLEVEDNGLGIEPSFRPRLFNMFQRFHAHVEGSGVGLYMVRRMVENAGGQVTVQSQPSVGTTFTVVLPATR